VCRFLEFFISAEKGFKAKTTEELKKIMDCIFCYSYTWGMGGSLTAGTKEKFDYTIRDQFKMAQVPMSGTCFDYFYDLKKEKVFKPWSGKVPAFVYDKELSYFDLMVPTSDTVRYAYKLETLMMQQKPMFFTGNSGVGKSVMIANAIGIMKEQGKVHPVFINMSAQTSSARTQQSIEEKLEKRNRTSLGPPINKKLAVFVDDINMPTVETYGAQPPIELLRLFVDKGGMYERNEWSWRDVVDSTVIACAAPPSGGRAVLTLRFTRRFNMFCLPEASPGTLTTIFASILKGFLSTGFSDNVKNKQEAAIKSTIEIYTRIQNELRATPAKFHYSFNLRDVSKVVQGICMVKPQSVPNDEIFYKLWVNESMRVFYDRLINDDDRAWFINLTMELLTSNFRANPDKNELFVESRIMFGDLLKLDAPVQLYECIMDKKKLLKTLYGALDEYNMSNQNKMNLVLFDDALEHILRIGRVLKQPRGHIMLIGVGGSGK
jgi:dynein heavy chain, axonemal